MKKNIILVLFVLLSVGVYTALDAQTPKKKKKKKATTAQTKDTVATQPVAPPPVAATPPADDVIPDSSHFVLDTLVAVNDSLGDYSLDNSRPVDGFYKQTMLKGAKPFAFPKINKNNIKFYKYLQHRVKP